MNYRKHFHVEPDSKVDLAKVDPSFTDHHETAEHALPEITAYASKLGQQQYLMYAEDKRSLLICLQGRDAAGKDGTINHVLSAMNPQGCTCGSPIEWSANGKSLLVTKNRVRTVHVASLAAAS